MSSKVNKTKVVDVMTIEDDNYNDIQSSTPTSLSATKKRGVKKNSNAAIMSSYKGKKTGKGKKRGGKGSKDERTAVKESKVPGQYKEPTLNSGQVNDNEWLVENIVGKKIDGGIIYYFIKWQDWASSANTWEPIDNLGGCEDMMKEFEKAESAKRKLAAPGWRTTDSDLTLGNNAILDPMTNDELDEKYGVLSIIPKDKEIEEVLGIIHLNEELCFLVRWKTKGTTTDANVKIEPEKEEEMLDIYDDNGMPFIGGNVNIIRNHVMKIRFPQELIHFYEIRIKFDNEELEEYLKLENDKLMSLAIKANDVLGQSVELNKQLQDHDDNMDDIDHQMDTYMPICDNNNEGKNYFGGAGKYDQYGLPLVLDGQDNYGSTSDFENMSS